MLFCKCYAVYCGATEIKSSLSGIYKLHSAFSELFRLNVHKKTTEIVLLTVIIIHLRKLKNQPSLDYIYLYTICEGVLEKNSNV